MALHPDPCCRALAFPRTVGLCKPPVVGRGLEDNTSPSGFEGTARRCIKWYLGMLEGGPTHAHRWPLLRHSPVTGSLAPLPTSWVHPPNCPHSKPEWDTLTPVYLAVHSPCCGCYFVLVTDARDRLRLSCVHRLCHALLQCLCIDHKLVGRSRGHSASPFACICLYIFAHEFLDCFMLAILMPCKWCLYWISIFNLIWDSSFSKWIYLIYICCCDTRLIIDFFCCISIFMFPSFSIFYCFLCSFSVCVFLLIMKKVNPSACLFFSGSCLCNF